MQLSETNPSISSSQTKSLSTRIGSLLTQTIPKCLDQRNTSYICISKKCQQPSPFVCVTEQCPCSQQHEICQQVKLRSFVKIFDKKQNIKSQIQQKITFRTDRLIDEISDFRDVMVKRIRQSEVQLILGNQFQKKWTEQNEKLILLTKIKENDLTGSLMSQIWQADQKIDDQKQLSQFIQSIDKTFDHLTQNLKKDLQTLLNKVTNKKQLKIYWNPQLKGQSQQISGKRVKRRPGSFSDSRFTLLQPSLTKMKADIVTWQVTALNVKGWVGLGICIKSIIEKNNFNFTNDPEAQHGSYIISNNGYSWAQRNPTQNNVTKNGIYFSTGDKIEFEMNFKTFELQYTNLTSKQTGKINVVQKNLKENDEYYICSLLGIEGEEVEMRKIVADGVELEWLA